MSAAVKHFSALPELFASAAATLVSEVNRLAEKQNQVVVGLCGGRSVAEIFKIISEKPDALSKNALQKIRFFMVDERVVPLRHPDSNYNLVDEHLAVPLVVKGKVKAEQFFPFNGANPQALASYNRDLAANGGCIDVALVSAGEDGHVAALFPRHPSFQNEETAFIDFHQSPKPPEHRMSASRKLLLKSETILLLVTGDAKQAAWENYKNSSLKTEECPAKLVDQVPSGFVFTDRK